MSDIAISVESLGKRYSIGGKQEKYKTLRGTLTDAFVAPFRRATKLLKGQATGAAELDETIWALKDVSFEIKRGEVVGIIGRNGAGKSTLLKILSRITEPTVGFADIHGRVGSLLEVGTGFHPELTGRENICLAGSIIGMKRAEIDNKFDEIVAFAEIERFIDTPVKHYSSGMILRLGFAVSAHLEPQILIVDEVLAVGDTQFQKKCLGKMGEVAKEGRTVLLVSHNMAAILSLCEKVSLLDEGRLINSGRPAELVEQYLQINESMAAIPLHQRKDRGGEGFARLISVTLSNATDPSLPQLRCGDSLRVELTYESDRELDGATFTVGIYGPLNQSIYRLDSEKAGGLNRPLPPRGKLVCVTDPLNLSPGRCLINLAIYVRSSLVDYVQQAGFFDVGPEDFYGTGALPPSHEVPCLIHQEWWMES